MAPRLAAADDCACVDIPVPSSDGTPKQGVRSENLEHRLGPQAAQRIVAPPPIEHASYAVPRARQPEPELRLALIRSVVLLV